MRETLEKNLEKGLFASRWFIAPVYIILAISLGIITLKVIQEFIHVVPEMFSMTVREVMLFVLHVVDLALVGNLILMIIFAGYENFVSKISAAENSEDKPSWIRGLGWVSEDEKIRLLRNSSILLVPSEYEGQPMVVLEALACGLPVCVSDRLVDVPEGIKVATYGDVKDWSRVISELLKSPPVEATLLESSQPYRVESISNEWKRVYESAIVL